MTMITRQLGLMRLFTLFSLLWVGLQAMPAFSDDQQIIKSEDSNQPYEKLIALLGNLGRSQKLTTNDAEGLGILIEEISKHIGAQPVSFDLAFRLSRALDDNDVLFSGLRLEAHHSWRPFRRKIWLETILKAKTAEEYAKGLLYAHQRRNVATNVCHWTPEERLALFKIGALSRYEVVYRRDPLLLFSDALGLTNQLKQANVLRVGERGELPPDLYALGRLLVEFAPMVAVGTSNFSHRELLASGKDAELKLDVLAGVSMRELTLFELAGASGHRSTEEVRRDIKRGEQMRDLIRRLATRARLQARTGVAVLYLAPCVLSSATPSDLNAY